MDAKIFLIALLIVAGIYLFPQATAKLTGGHAWEVNRTGSAANLQCTRCHQYIVEELNTTLESRNTFARHRRAAGNSSYTSTLLNPNVANTTTDKFCLMCHLAKITVPRSHTQILVRACIDVNCHGNNGSTNNTFYPEAGGMGFRLGNFTNVHERIFDVHSGFSSGLPNETGANYSQGFFLCLGCHTQVGINIERLGEGESYAHNDTNEFAGNPRRYL